ncbi:MAG: 4Fe-4S dicluster domain-containing protein [Lachnospiraceae bacterium]
MGLIFDLDIDKCSACGACAIACMDQNDVNVEEGECPYRTTGQLEQGEIFDYISTACFHCEDAPCITACPCACIRKAEDTGLTVYDTTRCIGCHSCAMACPFGAPVFGADGKMKKCDGCEVRLAHGLEPACVRNCPTGALICVNKADYQPEQLKRSLRKIYKV